MALSFILTIDLSKSPSSIILLTQEINIDGNLAINPEGDNSKYALVGPFTNWYIQIDEDYNKDLDLSKVEEVSVEFREKSCYF